MDSPSPEAPDTGHDTPTPTDGSAGAHWKLVLFVFVVPLALIVLYELFVH